MSSGKTNFWTNPVVSIDKNIYPLHSAIVGISDEVSPLSHQRKNLHKFLQYSKSKKDYDEWLIVRKMAGLAYNKGKTMAIEGLKKVNKGYRTDDKAQPRKRLHHWNARKPLQKIERKARLRGIEVMEAHPTYTSIIGAPKRSPQLRIDKGITGVYVINRRTLGFGEVLLKNCERLLEDKEFLWFAFESYKQEEQKLKEKLEKEANKHKQNAKKDNLPKVQSVIELIKKKLEQSHKREPTTCSEMAEENTGREVQAGSPTGPPGLGLDFSTVLIGATWATLSFAVKEDV